jgi:hypothetical protein
LCDITLCADHAVLFDPHFGDLGAVPGDGQGLTFQELMGLKRAAYYLYASDKIDAQTAREIGLVNEVVPLGRRPLRAADGADAGSHPGRGRNGPYRSLAKAWHSQLPRPLALDCLDGGVGLEGIVTFGLNGRFHVTFVLKRLGFDPASASAPFVATLCSRTDSDVGENSL